MAKGMREIKHSIRSKQNMKQITSAMELVAASRLRKAQETAIEARPYTDKMKQVVTDIAAAHGQNGHPMLKSRPIKKSAYLVITSDRGLAGGYNGNILRAVEKEIYKKHRSAEEYVIFTIGQKGKDFFKIQGLPIFEALTGLSDFPKFLDIKDFTSLAVQGFLNEDYDELILAYNEFHNALTQIPTLKQLLPLSDIKAPNTTETDFLYDPSAEEVLASLLPKYAETLIFSALLEGKASEFGARMTAMGNATKNATNLIDSLTLQYNRARQAVITQEISEIVAGANAQN